ncbi:GTP cyclohydrolase 1 [Iris pallida]|uniref:GTP cyclohydrolase 1 n=1 Tax=Iris pallida TaxID=29817 RepID=A0AAX6FHU9_IRIPA|nr:GTP cyclohydrolase 1 [Iris pallida]
MLLPIRYSIPLSSLILLGGGGFFFFSGCPHHHLLLLLHIYANENTIATPIPSLSFSLFVCCSMGALEEARFAEELRLELSAADCESESEDERSSASSAAAAIANQKKIEDAVRLLLQGLGEDHEREGIRKTPLRVTKAFAHATQGYGQKVRDIVQGALFPEAGLDNVAGYAGGDGGLVVVRDINLFSYCESCLLPFSVQCHVGYVPSGQRVVGLSKLSRVADVFAKRLQEPQRLANEICAALQNSIKPAGVAIALQCRHIQFPEAIQCNPNPVHPSKHEMQGWFYASVFSSSGVFKKNENNSFWDDFLALLKFRGVSVELEPPAQPWCPARSLELPQCNGHSTGSISNGRMSPKTVVTQSVMTSAVTSILESLGEDPLRKELVGTPFRYVQWLMNFKRSSLEAKQNGYSTLNFRKKRIGVDVGNSQDEIHSELNLPFCSQCEHHLLPFYGVVHVGYYGSEGGGGAMDRSFIQSLVHFYGCKLQVQERLTRQIAESIFSALGRGVMVVVEANHICMISRGIEKVGSSTATIALTGQFAHDAAAKANFLRTISESTASGG